jgi:hypothetical protein
VTFTTEQTAALSAPLHTSHVKRRSQAGRSLSYVEAWHAIAEANRIFGFDHWHRETIEARCVSERERKIGAQGKDGWAVSYVSKVRVEVFAGERCIIREGTGAGHGIDVDLGLAHESAIKESESDAMKRALMTFGNPFGLALYDKTQANVTSARPTPPTPPGVMTGAELQAALEGSVQGVQTGRKSSAQAKRDGDDVTIKTDIGKADHAGLKDWHENFDSYTSHLPASWLDSIHNMLELRLEELNGEANVADEASEMDAAFRASVGTASPARVAGSNAPHHPAR